MRENDKHTPAVSALRSLVAMASPVPSARERADAKKDPRMDRDPHAPPIRAYRTIGRGEHLEAFKASLYAQLPDVLRAMLNELRGTKRQRAFDGIVAAELRKEELLWIPQHTVTPKERREMERAKERGESPHVACLRACTVLPHRLELTAHGNASLTLFEARCMRCGAPSTAIVSPDLVITLDVSLEARTIAPGSVGVLRVANARTDTPILLHTRVATASGKQQRLETLLGPGDSISGPICTDGTEAASKPDAPGVVQ